MKQHHKRVPPQASRAGLTSIGTVMLVAITMIILLGLYLLADPLGKSEGSLQAATEQNVQSLIDGKTTGSSGSDGQPPPSTPGDPPPEPPLDDGDDEEPEDDDEDLKEDPFAPGFGTALATGVLGDALQRGVDYQSGLLSEAVSFRDAAARARDAADLALQQALKKGNVSSAEIAALRRNLVKATQILNDYRLDAGKLAKELAELERVIERASKAASTFNSYMILVDAEEAAAKARREGKYREAHRITCGAALEFSTAVIADFAGVFSQGLKGSIAAYASENIARLAGRVAGDATFTHMVNFSHFLYQQSWWPKNIKPRFPPGYEGT